MVAVGHTGKPFELVVESGKVREFARATKSSNPAYFVEEPVSPATFLMTARLWTEPENTAWGDEPLNMERILHGGQEFVFHGPPPRAGTRLTGVTRVDKAYEKEGKRGGTMKFVESVTEYRDSADNLVAEVRNTLIETAKSTAAA